jgi:poly-gamma-glutamate synthesis protein (capsule biosynthesis protein)
MTGVTAMSRDTALRMEKKGVLYPTLRISDTLSAADITHVSNEIPFLDDCEVDATPNNLVLCSDTKYWEALKAIGTDIVGLSGNHVNDFGYDGARRSLQFYRDNKIPIYGSGLNVEEACTPLMGEHNGNTFAFIAALAWWPDSAWATEDLPGACYYYDNKDRIKAMVQDLSPKVDVVSVELQFYESYDPFPTAEQVTDFREVRDWGADIVTGVQSHVPQAMEPYGVAEQGGPGMIVYGLGNLFFDQMWSWDTRTELYARHTIYDGRLLSTEILTAVLEDYAQPRWASTKERAEILNRIFDAAPKRP